MFIYICLSKTHILKPKFIWLFNMTVFRDGAFKELIKVKEGYKHGALIQYDWYVHKKRETRVICTRRKGDMRTQ